MPTALSFGGARTQMVNSEEPNTASPDDGSNARRAERIPLRAEVHLRRPGQLSFRVDVFDLSPQGCKIEFVDRPKIGDAVWVKFFGLEAMEARVRWIDGHIAGVQFVNEIHLAVFENVINRLSSR